MELLKKVENGNGVVEVGLDAGDLLVAFFNDKGSLVNAFRVPDSELNRARYMEAPKEHVPSVDDCPMGTSFWTEMSITRQKTLLKSMAK